MTTPYLTLGFCVKANCSHPAIGLSNTIFKPIAPNESRRRCDEEHYGGGE
jgi:hypothetical protein